VCGSKPSYQCVCTFLGWHIYVFTICVEYVPFDYSWRRRYSKTIIVTALVLSHLHYCNAVLAGLPASTLAPFQRVLHAAACTVLDLKPRDRVTLALRALHWLPVAERIQYKLFAGSQVASGTHAGIYRSQTF